jgi:hypothetical protein
MLQIQGTLKTLCDGIGRRDLLQIGGFAALGLSLADLPVFGAEVPRTGPAPPGFGRAKSCILLFPYGSPSSHETFDPKPEAPAEIQGEMKGAGPAVSDCRQRQGSSRVAGLIQ